MLTIARCAPHEAEAEAREGAIAALINRAYAAAESDLWTSPAPRTHAAETAAAIGAGELFVAHWSGALAGAVCCSVHDASTGWFGMLAVDPAQAGHGIARALVSHVEAEAAARGATRMRIEVLQPSQGHAHMARLLAWYQRLGYQPGERLDLAALDPSAVSLLHAPCAVQVMHRQLVA